MPETPAFSRGLGEGRSRIRTGDGELRADSGQRIAFVSVARFGGSDSPLIRPAGNMRCERRPLGAAIDAESEHEAVASAYLEKYGHFADTERYGRAMAETAAELFDDARRNSLYQLLRLELVS